LNDIVFALPAPQERRRIGSSSPLRLPCNFVPCTTFESMLRFPKWLIQWINPIPLLTASPSSTSLPSLPIDISATLFLKLESAATISRPRQPFRPPCWISSLSQTRISEAWLRRRPAFNPSFQIVSFRLGISRRGSQRRSTP
ncbi:hypothetical protein LINPERPRIM_LOCUS22072, partial [Linum perenne]